jgi:hypothetical protein
MLDDLRRVVLWPLRSFGLEPGRALINAQPSPQERRAQRLEQWAYVQARFGDRSAAGPPASRMPSAG